MPQIVLIDRKGVIRAQTPPTGDEKMQEENNLRIQIEKLLQEGATMTKQKATPKKRPT